MKDSNKKLLNAFLIGAGVAAGIAVSYTLITKKVYKTFLETAVVRNDNHPKNEFARKVSEDLGNVIKGNKTVKDSIREYAESPVKRAKKEIASAFEPDNIYTQKKAEEDDTDITSLLYKPTEPVEIVSYDGTKLAGHLLRAENEKRVVLAMHGWRDSWVKSFSEISSFFSDEGCTVLYAEQRAQGESEGTLMGFGMTERFDCIEWVRWLNENGFSDTPIYLYGISMGASTVLMASGSDDLPSNVKGIIADCGFTSAGSIWKHIIDVNVGLNYDRHIRMINSMCKKMINSEPDAYTTLDAMEKNTRPVLFIHGNKDTFVPMYMTEQNYEACKAPKDLLIIDGAGHCKSYHCNKAMYEGAVRDFFAAND